MSPAENSLIFDVLQVRLPTLISIHTSYPPQSVELYVGTVIFKRIDFGPIVGTIVGSNVGPTVDVGSRLRFVSILDARKGDDLFSTRQKRLPVFRLASSVFLHNLQNLYCKLQKSDSVLHNVLT